MKLFKTVGLILLSAVLYANDGHSWEIDCSDSADLSITKLQEVECHILKDIWEDVNGPHWIDNTNWGQRVYAGEWYGIRMHEDNSSISEYLPGLKNFQDNNLSGTFPDSIGNFINLKYFDVIHQKHLTSPIPQEALKNLDSLYMVFFDDNNNTGKLPPALPQNIERVAFTNLPKLESTTIPASYADLTELRDLNLYRIPGLHGALPDLSRLTQLNSLWIFGNAFTFSDLEPQAVYLEQIDVISYAAQADINESGHIVYFDDTLRIEPRLAANPSGHDYYKWHQFTGSQNFDVSYTQGERILLHPNATMDDEGWYCYDVNNSVITQPCDGHYKFRCLVLHSTCSGTGIEGIRAIHDHAPIVSNLTPAKSSTEGETYTYSATISDTDSSDTVEVTSSPLPAWLSLTANSTSFTLSGSPDNGTAGDYDINLTVTDGKIPVHIDYTLHVNPSVAALPDGFSATNGVYSHDTTQSSITGAANLAIVNDGLVLTEACSGTVAAFAQLDSDGKLTTGYQNCTTHVSTQTLTDTYPDGAHAQIQSEHIFIVFPLSQDITLGAD